MNIAPLAMFGCAFVGLLAGYPVAITLAGEVTMSATGLDFKLAYAIV